MRLPLKLSILIVNWNSKDYVRSCLETVRKTCGLLSPQIVVVDGGSFDGCGEMLASEFPEVEFLQSDDNVGFGRSNNLGFAKVRGEFLLLLNPDTELLPESVSELLGQMTVLPKVGMIGPRLLNSDGSLQTSCVKALPTPVRQMLDSEFLRRLFPKSRLWGTWEAFSSSTPVEVEAVSGACMLLPSNVFRQVGGFSPEFFMYGEDMDLCAKVRKQGFKVYHDPRAQVVHHGSGSSQLQINQFSTVMVRVAGVIYMRRNHGHFTAAFYRLLQGVSAAARISAVLMAFLLLSGPRRAAARLTLVKWWYVLRWAVGISPIRSPATPPAEAGNVVGSSGIGDVASDAASVADSDSSGIKILEN